MITKKQLDDMWTAYREYGPDGVSYSLPSLLEVAESEIRLRESIAITDRNTRTMMNELHELRDKLRALVDVLLPLAEIADAFDGRDGVSTHRDHDVVHAWHVTGRSGEPIERALTAGMLRHARDVLVGVK